MEKHNPLLEEYPDIKAEFMAVCWLENGVTPEQILFRALGPFKRRSHQDVETASEQEIGGFKGWVIETNRSGIYDHLPEQLFHLPPSRSADTSKKKTEEMRIQREKERKTRLFFLPVEQEFFLHRIRTAQIEQQANALDTDSLLIKELRKFWQIPTSIADTLFIGLLDVLPLASEYAGDLKKTESILSAILEMPVTIEALYGMKHRVDTAAKIEEVRLGFDTILGGEMASYLPYFKIKLHLQNVYMLEDCLQNEGFNVFLNWFLGWLIPVEYDYVTELLLSYGQVQCQLVERGFISPRLGFCLL